MSRSLHVSRCSSLCLQIYRFCLGASFLHVGYRPVLWCHRPLLMFATQP
uniref:Uncharacterized protein n=1 Tax=Arundo donax TaxID=35708 RepID=A0A0A8Z5U8_ARUDO